MARRPPRLRFYTLFMAYWLPVLVYITLILVLSAQQNLDPPRFPFSDKVFHVLEYLILGVLLVRAIRASLRIARPGVAALAALCCGIVVGTADEIFQSFIPGRESSGMDLVADTAGLVLAQLLVLLVRRG